MGLLRWFLLATAAAQVAVARSFFSRPPVEKQVHAKRQLATFGPHVSLGQADSEFIELTTFFVPGHPPAKTVGSLFVWPGLFDQKNRSQGDLIQTVVEAAEEKTMQLTCLAKQGQWCVRPFVVSKGSNPATPDHGKPIDGTDRIKINLKKAPDKDGLWTQTIWNVGKSQDPLFTWAKGAAACKWLELATESQGGNLGSADTQIYFDTTLVLKNPEPDLNKRFIKTGQIEATNPRTTDGGKTWIIDKVTIPPMLPGTAWKPL